MTEKRMLIVDAELAKKIDDNRGEMSRSEFISFLIDSRLNEEPASLKDSYVSKEEFEHFTSGIKDLLRNFLDFFISYGLELGEAPKDQTYEELSRKLQKLARTEKSSSK